MACAGCAMGALHEGTPTGREETLHGLPTYITEPSPSNTPVKGHIVIIPDALGWKFNNSRILADKYAQKCQARVYIPEFMDGHAMDPSMFESMDTLTGNGWMLGKVPALARAISGFVPFMYYNRLAATQPRVFDWFRAFRENTSPSTPIGAAGFCWGGKFVFLLSADDQKTSAAASSTIGAKSLIDAGFTAHPSNLVLPIDAQNVKLPLSVAVGDVDQLLPLKQVEVMREVLEAQKKSHPRAECEVEIIPGAKHGFAIRAHPGDEAAVKQGVKAEEQAVQWFNRWFAKR